ncbi:MAG: hypothetical protein ACI89X_004655 [Planctomycetota bacterium]
MPSAIRQNHELADKGLISILVEAQGADDQKLESFLWQRFPDNDCFASVGCFVPIPESRGIPHGAVIGVDGKLLWAGNPIRDKAKIEELVEAQLKLMKKGWGDSREAKKVRAALYARGNFAAAAAIVTAMADGDEKSMLQKEVHARYAINKAAVDNLIKQGFWVKAQDAAKRLQTGVGTNAAWVADAAELVESFATDDGKAELSAAKKLAKIIKNMRKGKLEKAPKALKKLIAKIGQTSVGARASRMLAALEG